MAEEEIGTYDFKPHRNGYTFLGAKIVISNQDGPKNLEGAHIEMEFGKNKFSTRTGELEITNAAAGEFYIKQQVIKVSNPGSFNFLISVTLSDGFRRPYIKGVFPII